MFINASEDSATTMDYMINKANVSDPQVPIITTENGGRDVRLAIQGDGLSTGSFIVEPDRTIYDIPANKDNFLSDFETLLLGYGVPKHDCDPTDVILLNNKFKDNSISISGRVVSWNENCNVQNIDIVNLQGKTIFSEAINKNQTSFLVKESVSQGLYLLKFNSNNKETIYKIIVKH